MNKKVGVVSTARITHATPAGVYARSVDRTFEASVPDGCVEQVDIAQQVYVCGGNSMRPYNSIEIRKRQVYLAGWSRVRISKSDIRARLITLCRRPFVNNSRSSA